MSFNNMLTDRVDIYWLQTRQSSGSYGVPGETEYYYNTTPDLKNVRCSVQTSGWRSEVTQANPNIEISETLLMFLPISVELKLNDKIIFNGVEYTCKVPMKVRGHHTKVEIVRIDRQ